MKCEWTKYLDFRYLLQGRHKYNTRDIKYKIREHEKYCRWPWKEKKSIHQHQQNIFFEFAFLKYKNRKKSSPQLRTIKTFFTLTCSTFSRENIIDCLSTRSTTATCRFLPSPISYLLFVWVSLQVVELRRSVVVFEYLASTLDLLIY